MWKVVSIEGLVSWWARFQLFNLQPIYMNCMHCMLLLVSILIILNKKVYYRINKLNNIIFNEYKSSKVQISPAKSVRMWQVVSIGGLES